MGADNTVWPLHGDDLSDVLSGSHLGSPDLYDIAQRTVVALLGQIAKYISSPLLEIVVSCLCCKTHQCGIAGMDGDGWLGMAEFN